MGCKQHRQLFLPTLVALCAGAFAAGCGSTSSSSKAPDYATALKGAPGPLAALYRQTDYGRKPAFSEGGLDGVDAEVAKLHGYPVVVNVWGSWCNPCRQEFPYLQQASAKFGKHVAFIGVDTGDQRGAASTFLKEDPIPYPNYEDPNQDSKSHFGVLGFPSTLIYDSKGKVVHMNVGGYASQQTLFADINQYAH